MNSFFEGPIQVGTHIWIFRQSINMDCKYIFKYTIYTFTYPKTFTQYCVNVFDKYLHYYYISVSVKTIYIQY